MNQQQPNYNLRTVNSGSLLLGGGGGGGGVDPSYWCQIFALDSDVINTQTLKLNYTLMMHVQSYMWSKATIVEYFKWAYTPYSIVHRI